MSFTIHPLGDSALTITFGTTIDQQINEKVMSVFQLLQHQNYAFVKDIIPAYASLTIVYDIMECRKIGQNSAYQNIRKIVETVIINSPSAIALQRKVHRVPVCYENEYGLDLQNLCEAKNIATDDLVNLHTSVAYRVYMIGFLPGFAYMGTVDTRIAMPRKSTPARSIPAGSVGIADAQTGIYPFNSPGGWNIIGRTFVKIFEPKGSNPCLFSPGDTVYFYPITFKEFEKMNQHK